MVNKFSFATAGLVSISTALCISGANAASLTISTTVNGNEVLSGPSFTVTNDFLGTDTISLNVSGTVDIAAFDLPEGYTVNAAGITTQPGRIYSQLIPTGNVYSGNPFGFNYGALLLGNTSLGFFQLFAPNVANGLGSGTPPTDLSLNNVNLTSIFGAGLTNGTVLQFRTADTGDGADNNGTFTVSGSINSATTAVPEPFTIIGTLIGGTAAVRMRKKLKSKKV